MKRLKDLVDPVFEFLRVMPKGRVTTYKIVAQKCGVPSARNVGWILKQNTDPEKVLCYKVVRSDGSLAKGYKFGGRTAQKKRLIADGIEFINRWRVKANQK